MAATGIPQERIAAALKVTQPTLRKHCRTELDTAADQANAEIARSLFAMATRGPASGVKLGACQFWLCPLEGASGSRNHQNPRPDGL